jgi:MFS family permease
MITLLNAAAILPAILMLANDLEVSVTKVTYLIGVQILFLGISPLFWKPVAQRYGRRPIFLISALGGGLFNLACARTTTFGAQIVTRILVSVFLSPSLAMGGAVVTETFFAHERAMKMVGYKWSLPHHSPRCFKIIMLISCRVSGHSHLLVAQLLAHS